MKGPYTAALHPWHPLNPHSTPPDGPPCNATCVMGYDEDDGFQWQTELLTVWVDPDCTKAQKIADALNAMEAKQ